MSERVTSKVYSNIALVPNSTALISVNGSPVLNSTGTYSVAAVTAPVTDNGGGIEAPGTGDEDNSTPPPPPATMTQVDFGTYSTSNFKSSNVAIVPVTLNTIQDSSISFVEGDEIYTSYPASSIDLAQKGFTYNNVDYTLISKDIASKTGGSSFALLQVRGIDALGVSSIDVSKLLFIVKRGDSIFKAEPKANTNLTQKLLTDGISNGFNLLNAEMGTSAEDFFNFELGSASFVEKSTNNQSSLSRSRIGMSRVTKSIASPSVNIDTWLNFDENQFSNPVTVYATVKQQDQVVLTANDKLAAYVNGELRGVSSKLLNIDGNNVFEITVFTNATNTTDFVNFKLYKHTAYESMTDRSVYNLEEQVTLSGISGGRYSIGTGEQLVFILGYFEKLLNGPFDDFSFNVDLDDPSKENVFGGSLNDITSYRNQEFTAIKAGSLWLSSNTGFGNFSDLPMTNTTFYSIRLAQGVSSTTIAISGKPIGINKAINMKAGYNWIGYTSAVKQSLGDVWNNAQTDINASGNLVGITTRSDGAALYTSTVADVPQFIGSLSEMKPGGSYVIYIKQDTTLVYDSLFKQGTVEIVQGDFNVSSFVNPLVGTDLRKVSLDANGVLGALLSNGVTVSQDFGYNAFGEYETDWLQVSTPFGVVISDNLKGNITHMKINVGFTTGTDGLSAMGANGVIDYKLETLAAVLNMGQETNQVYVVSEIPNELPVSAPFAFSASKDFVLPAIPDEAATEIKQANVRIVKNTTDKQIEVYLEPFTGTTITSGEISIKDLPLCISSNEISEASVTQLTSEYPFRYKIAFTSTTITENILIAVLTPQNDFDTINLNTLQLFNVYVNLDGSEPPPPPQPVANVYLHPDGDLKITRNISANTLDVFVIPGDGSISNGQVTLKNVNVVSKIDGTGVIVVATDIPEGGVLQDIIVGFMTTTSLSVETKLITLTCQDVASLDMENFELEAKDITFD